MFRGRLRRFIKYLLTLIFIVFLTLILLYRHQESKSNHSFTFQYAINTQPATNYSEKKINGTTVEDGFAVRSPSCHIPNVDPFHESIREFIYKWEPVVCSTKEPMTKTIYDPKTELHKVKIIKNRLPQYDTNAENIECCYSIITRPYFQNYKSEVDDDRHECSKFVCFNDEATLPKGTEFLYVKCTSKHHWFSDYQTIHGMVPNKGSPESTDTTKYSVLLFGIDSISRPNLIRTMPQTVQYLKENEWLSLEGYTKVGDNTLVNLIPILTGLSLEQLESKYWKASMDKFDDCPFIWNAYKNRSYVTAYVEDTPYIGTFNYQKYGFLNSPTDYYTRPLMVVGEEKLEIKWDAQIKFCLGGLPSAEYLFQYVTEFAERLQNQPYFNLFWTNSFSHNELNQPFVMDYRVKTFLQDLHPFLNSTIMIFFSDHGMRFGRIRETYIGWLEERSPFIYFWLPPSFKASYPDKYSNLVHNRNRLTSPFDLHATLQEILHGTVVHPPPGCPECNSLFEEVPFDRKCEHAAIGSHWCTCSSDFDSVSTDDATVLKITYFVISHINEYLRKSMKGALEVGNTCAPVTLKKIMSARTRAYTLFQSTEQVVIFEVSPSGAVFEATVRGGKDFNLEHSLSRINAYGSQSSCVMSNAVLRKYCFCVND